MILYAGTSEDGLNTVRPQPQGLIGIQVIFLNHVTYRLKLQENTRMSRILAKTYMKELNLYNSMNTIREFQNISILHRLSLLTHTSVVS